MYSATGSCRTATFQHAARSGAQQRSSHLSCGSSSQHVVTVGWHFARCSCVPQEKALAQSFANALTTIGKFVIKKKVGEKDQIYGSVQVREGRRPSGRPLGSPAHKGGCPGAAQVAVVAPALVHAPLRLQHRGRVTAAARSSGQRAVAARPDMRGAARDGGAGWKAVRPGAHTRS